MGLPPPSLRGVCTLAFNVLTVYTEGAVRVPSLGTNGTLSAGDAVWFTAGKLCLRCKNASSLSHMCLPAQGMTCLFKPSRAVRPCSHVSC